MRYQFAHRSFGHAFALLLQTLFFNALIAADAVTSASPPPSTQPLRTDSAAGWSARCCWEWRTPPGPRTGIKHSAAHRIGSSASSWSKTNCRHLAARSWSACSTVHV